MAIKEFDNFDYKRVNEQKSLANQRLKYASIAFGVVLVIAVLVAFFSSLNLFPSRTTNITQPIPDTSKNANEELQAQQDKTTAYKNAGIPYKDPQGRFEIKFLTPYVSDQIAVVINTPNNPSQVRSDADQIIAKAKKTVAISNVYYINGY